MYDTQASQHRSIAASQTKSVASTKRPPTNRRKSSFSHSLTHSLTHSFIHSFILVSLFHTSCHIFSSLVSLMSTLEERIRDLQVEIVKNTVRVDKAVDEGNGEDEKMLVVVLLVIDHHASCHFVLFLICIPKNETDAIVSVVFIF
jgi:hypothetical protein